MSNKAKGSRRERQAAELYEKAGYDVYNPPETRYGSDTDLFNLFDGVAVDPIVGPPVWYQVKSNRAEGIEQWFEDAIKQLPPGESIHFLVCHDNAGWRLAVPKHTADVHESDSAYEWVVDGRDSGNKMGEEVVHWLTGGKHKMERES